MGNPKHKNLDTHQGDLYHNGRCSQTGSGDLSNVRVASRVPLDCINILVGPGARNAPHAFGGGQMSQGFIKLRRGLIEHVQTGKLTGSMFAVYMWIHFKADFETGRVFRITARSIGEDLSMSVHAVRRCLNRLEKIGLIRRFYTRRNAGYRVLINKYEPTSGARVGYRLNAWASDSYENLAFEPASQDASDPVSDPVSEGASDTASEGVSDPVTINKKEEKIYNKKEKKNTSTVGSNDPPVQVPSELEAYPLYKSCKPLCNRWEELKVEWARAYPAVDLNKTLAESHAWQMASARHRKVDQGRFLNNWMKRNQDNASKNGGSNGQYGDLKKVHRHFAQDRKEEAKNYDF